MRGWTTTVSGRRRTSRRCPRTWPCCGSWRRPIRWPPRCLPAAPCTRTPSPASSARATTSRWATAPLRARPPKSKLAMAASSSRPSSAAARTPPPSSTTSSPSFARALGKALRDDGRRLSLTLPPPGPQREAYDWPLLGQAADIIKVLPIADPLGYWETMPDALDRLVEDVDPKKVMLVVSPFSAQITDGGDTKALGYLQAMLLASEIKVREPTDPADIKTDVGVKAVAVNLAQSEGATDLRWSDEAAATFLSLGEPDKKTVY